MPLNLVYICHNNVLFSLLLSADGTSHKHKLDFEETDYNANRTSSVNQIHCSSRDFLFQVSLLFSKRTTGQTAFKGLFHANHTDNTFITSCGENTLGIHWQLNESDTASFYKFPSSEVPCTPYSYDLSK